VQGTHKALMARGVDSYTAEILSRDKWTIGKLKLMRADELEGLGLGHGFIANLSREARPPIPIGTLTSLLFASRYQCCICRDSSRPIIVHHIVEWAESRSHDADNLAVLCLQHHDEAHSRKTLSRNLDAGVLRDMKEKWEREVKSFDAESILSAMRLEYSNWNYLNELRIFELATTMNIRPTSIRGYQDLRSRGLVQSDGLPSFPLREDSFYMYEGPDILQRYFYVSSVLSAVIERLQIINVSDYLDKGTLKFSLVPGDFIFVQGAHTFSPLGDTKSYRGRGQVCTGVRRANNVEVRYVFDRWEATSSSAKNCWLTGTRNQGSLVHVKDMSRDGGHLVITGTVIAICSNLGELKRREYAHKWLNWRYERDDLDEDDEDWLTEEP
jgi:hypothetical protein